MVLWFENFQRVSSGPGSVHVKDSLGVKSLNCPCPQRAKCCCRVTVTYVSRRF